MTNIKLVVMDGGGTIWDSMSVLWEHYKAGFLFCGLTSKIDEFPYSLSLSNELSSLDKYNSRKSIGRLLSALHIDNRSEKEVSGILDSPNPVTELENIINKVSTEKKKNERLYKKMGTFFSRALYNYDEKKYPLCKDVIETLEELRIRGIIIVLLSNRWKRSTKRVLKGKGILSYFNYVHAPENRNEPSVKDLAPVKDKYMNIELDEMVFVGDSVLDINSGKKFGLKTFAVLSGMGSRRTLRLAKPDEYITTLKEISKYI